jgi:hypothetical protein
MGEPIAGWKISFVYKPRETGVSACIGPRKSRMPWRHVPRSSVP